jgi:hypothetical protein
MTFACPSCGHELRIGDRHAGKKAKCRHCGRIFTVPAASEMVAPEHVHATTADPPAEPELVVTEPAAEKAADVAAETLRDIADSLRSIHQELLRLRKMMFRFVFWSLVGCLVAGLWLWWSARSLQTNVGGGELDKLLKDLKGLKLE